MTLTVDTSGLLALMNRDDSHHAACVSAFQEDPGPYLISIAILSEIAWFLEDRHRFPSDAEHIMLDDIRAGAYTLDWNARDVDRIQELTERYRDLHLGLADAAVIACAERHGGQVLTTDLRHFPVVARGERTLTILP
jgi:predicted nucleic acid-binding protein